LVSHHSASNEIKQIKFHFLKSLAIVDVAKIVLAPGYKLCWFMIKQNPEGGIVEGMFVIYNVTC